MCCTRTQRESESLTHVTKALGVQGPAWSLWQSRGWAEVAMMVVVSNKAARMLVTEAATTVRIGCQGGHNSGCWLLRQP